MHQKFRDHLVLMNYKSWHAVSQLFVVMALSQRLPRQ